MWLDPTHQEASNSKGTFVLSCMPALGTVTSIWQNGSISPSQLVMVSPFARSAWVFLTRCEVHGHMREAMRRYARCRCPDSAGIYVVNLRFCCNTYCFSLAFGTGSASHPYLRRSTFIVQRLSPRHAMVCSIEMIASDAKHRQTVSSPSRTTLSMFLIHSAHRDPRDIPIRFLPSSCVDLGG